MSEKREVVAKVIPIHQWTHDGDKVLLVKYVPKGGKSTNDFQWPKSGPVESPNWSREPTCDSGGLFGWPWGVGIGGGKDPDYQGDWIVFAAKPEDVIDLGDKAKANSAEVIYYGDWWGALLKIDAGRMAWTIQAADGNAAATGERGSAAATGESGSAAATGWRGSAAATGESGSAAATGGMGSAAAAGGRGSAAATGWMGSAAATGGSGSAAATGGRGSAAATGESGSAAATGGMGSAAATGESSIAAATNHQSTVEAGLGGIAATTSENAYWTVRAGAVFIQRWKAENGTYETVVFAAADFEADIGKTLHIVRGEIQRNEGGNP